MEVSIEDANPTFSHFISVASIAVTATPCSDVDGLVSKIQYSKLPPLMMRSGRTQGDLESQWKSKIEDKYTEGVT